MRMAFPPTRLGMRQIKLERVRLDGVRSGARCRTRCGGARRSRLRHRRRFGQYRPEQYGGDDGGIAIDQPIRHGGATIGKQGLHQFIASAHQRHGQNGSDRPATGVAGAAGKYQTSENRISEQMERQSAGVLANLGARAWNRTHDHDRRVHAPCAVVAQSAQFRVEHQQGKDRGHRRQKAKALQYHACPTAVSRSAAAPPVPGQTVNADAPLV